MDLSENTKGAEKDDAENGKICLLICLRVDGGALSRWLCHTEPSVYPFGGRNGLPRADLVGRLWAMPALREISGPSGRQVLSPLRSKVGMVGFL